MIIMRVISPVESLGVMARRQEDYDGQKKEQ